MASQIYLLLGESEPCSRFLPGKRAFVVFLRVNQTGRPCLPNSNRDSRHIAETDRRLHTCKYAHPSLGFGGELRMLDSKQIKTLGLRFARALQTTVKTAGVFTVEHK